VRKHGTSGVEVGLDCGEGSRSVHSSHLLRAAGRTPNTDDLDLDKAGAQKDARGYIGVDDQRQTNVPGIVALGDCNGRGAFTHTSYHDHEIVADDLLKGAQRRVTDRIITYGSSIDPPLVRVGMTEAAVRASKTEAPIGVCPCPASAGRWKRAEPTAS
jgi:pyruvate/2-oxoglutarate dehydrogenase complex dihydrolipoamide dehydrogenase (E3) component